MKRKFPVIFLTLALVAAVFTLAGTEEEPPAGTKIVNVARAEYSFEGRRYVTNSNEVVTEVKPVYGFTILPDGSESDPAMLSKLPPGSSDCFSYVLKNTGNAPDGYDLSSEFVSGPFEPSSLSVVRDSNGNGVKDPGESVISGTDRVEPGGEVPLLLCFEIPTSANPLDYGNVNIKGTSREDPALVDKDNVSRVEITGAGSLKLTKSPDPSEVEPGDTVTWTVTGENVGSVPVGGTTVEVDGVSETGILLSDPISDYQKGVRYEPESLSSTRPGTKLYSTDGGSSWTDDRPPVEEIDALGYLISTAITPGERFQFSYGLEIAGEPELRTNVCRATYDDGRGNVESAEARGTLQVLSRPNLVIGPKDYPFGDSPGEQYFDPSGAAVNTETDRSYVKKVTPGDSLVYLNTLENGGSSTEVINLSIDSSSTLPDGWNVAFINLAGGPLSDSNGDGLVDVGPVAPGERVTIRVKVEVPYDPGDRPEGGWKAVIKTSLASDPTVYDLTVDEIATEEVERVWDLTKRVDSGTARYGDELTYTMKFKNFSNYPVKNVYIKDKLDPGLQAPSSVESGVIENQNGTGTISVEGNYSSSDHLISWEVVSGAVPPGFQGELTFKARVVESEDQLEVTKPVPMVRNHFSVTGCYVLEPDRCRRSRAVSDRVHTVIEDESILELEKSVNRERVKPGEVVSYTVTVRNPHPDITLKNVEIRDTLPHDFTYVDGSSVLDGSQRPDPVISSAGKDLEWEIGSLSPDEKRKLVFDVRLSGSITPGTYVNVAYASGSYEIVDPNSGKTIEIPATAGPARAAVLVVAGLLKENTSIVGRVFWDTNRNRYQDPGEKGIEEVRIVTQTGEYALTGENGLYHLIDLRPGARIVVADSNSIPRDGELVTESRKLRLTRGGPVRRVDFPVWREED